MAKYPSPSDTNPSGIAWAVVGLRFGGRIPLSNTDSNTDERLSPSRVLHFRTAYESNAKTGSQQLVGAKGIAHERLARSEAISFNTSKRKPL